MDNHPINTNSFTHWLRFVSLGKTDLYQISEPQGFDSAELSMMQNPQRFSRDNYFMADDKKQFTFFDGQFERGIKEQIQDVNGYSSIYLDHGFNWIMETRKKFGFEGKIEYILKKDDIEFVTGIFGMANPDTDSYTYFSCNIIQDENLSAYTKQEDTKINILGDKNVKNEPITPAETIKFLRKAIPVISTSEITTPNDYGKSMGLLGQDGYLYQPAIQLMTFGVENTFVPSDVETYVEPGASTGTINAAIDKYLVFQAKRKTINISIKISDINYFVDGEGNFINSSLTIRWGNSVADSQFLHYFEDIANDVDVVNESVVLNIPVLEIGQKIWIYFSTFNGSLIAGNAAVTITKTLKIELVGSSTSLNTIIEGVRYVDMMKQASKFIRNVSVNAPKFDIGGQFYDQVCYNRALIGQNKTLPFITTFKETMGSVEEVCGDFEIQKDEIYVGQFDDFYRNEEIGVFQIIPSKEYKESWNERFKLNSFSFGYKTFEQNRDTENTKEDVHTESSWIIPNDFVQNKKDIKLDFVRSGFSQQVAVDLEINKPSTSDDNDDKIYIQDIIPLPEDSFGEFGAILSNRWIDGKLQLLNRSLTGSADDVTINWNLLGITLGGNFYINEGSNIGTYTVTGITPIILTLTPVTSVTNIDGDAYVKLKWFYEDILYQIRTDEGFTIVEGISTPQFFPNLLYTIRINMIHWESYINTACFWQKGKQIVNSFFKNNVPLKTQFGDGTIYIENAPIEIDSLKPKILTPKIIELECVAEFVDMMDLIEQYKTKRGFVRCYDMKGKLIKGFIQSLAYVWRTNSLKLKLEEKYEEENLILTLDNGILTVNDVYYDLEGIMDWYKVTGDYFQAFDSKNRPICNEYHYEFILLNGQKYDSMEEFLNALKSL